MAITSINPATGEEIKTFESLADEQIDEKLELVARAFRRYWKTPFSERAEKMVRTAGSSSRTVPGHTSERRLSKG